jgi:hypothetical protein
MRGLVACLVLVVLAGCGARGPQQVPIDPALATLAPPDTVLLAGVRVDRLRDTPVFDRLAHGAAGCASLAAFVRDTGLDPAKDLWELLYAHNGADGVWMIRGQFSPTGLEPRLDREGARRTPYRGHMMIGDEEEAVLFINATTALLGPPPALESVLDGGERSAGIPAALRERLAAVDPGSQIWLVSTGGWMNSAAAPGNPGNLLGLLKKVQGVTLAANLDRGLALEVTGECATPEDAESLHGAVRAVLVLAQMGAPDQPATAALLDAARIERKESTLEVRADLAPELLKQVLDDMSAAPQP